MSDTEHDAVDYSAAVRKIVYPDYKPVKDFTLWLQGYRGKLRLACGLTAAQEDIVDEQVLKTIPGKLTSGTALDAYNALSTNTKSDYELLIKALTEEFLDPQERERFNNDLGFNKRKAGQTIKEFMQEIIKDQNTYSDIPEFIGTGDARVKNPQRVKDGLKRFKKGLRNKRGEKDNDLRNHMKYNLYKEEDITWENAYLVACRWEAAHDQPSSSESDDEDDVEIADPASTVATVMSAAPVASVPSFASGASTPYVITASVASVPPGVPASVASVAPGVPLASVATGATFEQSLAALAIAVRKNADDIQQLKYQQEQLAAQQKQHEAEVKTWQESTDYKMDRILWAVEGPPPEPE